MKDESLGLETKGSETLGLVLNFGTCLVTDENFWDSLVPVSFSWFKFYSVLSRSHPDLDEYFIMKLSLIYSLFLH